MRIWHDVFADVSQLQDGFSKKKARNIGLAYSLLSHAFFLMLIASLWLMVRLQFWRTAEVMMNSVVLLIALLFALILFIRCVVDRYSDPRAKAFFSTGIAVLYVDMFLSQMVILLDGVSGNPAGMMVLGTLLYIVGANYWLCFWEYLKCYYAPPKREKLIDCIGRFGLLGYIIAALLNIRYGFFFAVDEAAHIIYNNNDMISSVLICLIILFYFMYIIQLNCDRRTKWSLASYSLFPVVVLGIELFYTLKGYTLNLDSLLSISFLLPLYLIFFNIFEDRSRKLLEREVQNTELKTAVIISQIQPHFLYNSLSTIAALCDSDPKTARDATIAFSNYLRMNMNSIDRTTPVTLDTELEHVRTYLGLEQMRFPDKLKVEYDIAAEGFFVPALSLQPIVENAVKHGICAKKGGGTLRISTRESEDSYVIEIEDNGVGFAPDSVPKDGRSHVGIRNVRSRLSTMVGGSLQIDTIPGTGTKATITIPKKAGNTL